MEERDFTVVARIRPREQGTLDVCARKKDDCHINIGEKVYNAHKIYGQECKTAELFGDFINPSILAWVKCGATLNVLAYGQTASGKTFTISECLFLFGKLLFSSKIEVQVSCFELTAGNAINDLLADKQTESKGTASYSVMEDMHGIVQVNTSKINVACRDHYEQLVHASLSKRTTSATTKNEASSRSHAIFRITFISDTGAGMVNFLDLAGSERAASDSVNHSKDLMKQSIYINKTLMTLKECIRQRCLSSSLLSAQQQLRHLHIPYRGSKLTLVLKDAFELESRRPCHTLFIATVSPMKIDLSASSNTMRYASALVITTKKMYRNTSNCDPKDISMWNHDQVLTWFQDKLGTLLKHPKVLFPNQENGFSMSRVPEIEFIDRICNACEAGKVGTKRARAIYIGFWGLVIAERTRTRKALQNNWKKHVEKQKADELDFLQKMINN